MLLSGVSSILSLQVILASQNDSFYTMLLEPKPNPKLKETGNLLYVMLSALFGCSVSGVFRNIYGLPPFLSCRETA